MKRSVAIGSIIILTFSLLSPATPIFAESAPTDQLVAQTPVVTESLPPAVEVPPVTQPPVEEVLPPAVEAPAPPVETLSVQGAPTAIAPAVVVVAQPSSMPANGSVLISQFKITPKIGFDALELRNTTSKPVSLQDWRVEVLRFGAVDDHVCEIALSGWILPAQSISFARLADVSAESGVYGIDGCDEPDATVSDTLIRIYQHATLIEEVRPGVAGDQYERKGFTDTYRKGDFVNDFKKATRPYQTSQLYEPPAETNLQVIELLPYPAPCVPGDSEVSCVDYVRLYNPTDTPIALSDYQLRTGQVSQTSTSANTYALFGTIAPHGYAVIMQSVDNSALILPNSGGTAWLQDRHGVINYPSGVTPYESADTVGHTGRSWALDTTDNIWKWAQPSPAGENTFIVEEVVVEEDSSSELVPCRANQYRSEETNRCRNTTASGSTLTPCKNGQYRSEETNRCRSISLAGGTLVPCRDDQYRSEETNRCRNVATASAGLTPCKDDQYRSEETNRCRNIVQMSAVPYAVDETTVKNGSYVGWWVLGVLVALGAAIGIWEWRHELAGLVRRIGALGRKQ